VEAPVIPKLKVPLQMGVNGLATVEQDSVDDVAQCVYMLLATPRGERLEETDYGVEEIAWDGFPVDLDEWLTQITIWEPRATIETQDQLEGLLERLTIDVGLKQQS
jgi:phage baseplate assembly protein W